ncbi:MAG TPA: tetratricopeptide repeat-containing sensor histidine kinase [Chryseosolibacter sp.]|nr:tetratricopeptide repeat-containing sensor histidine kinase [Chryseosolibacter sp.]
MKRIVAFVFFLAGFASVSAQSGLDSLLKALEAAPGDQKMPIYQEIILSLWLNHPDSAMHYAKEGFSLAKRSNDLRTKAIATRLLGGVHYYKGNYDSAIKYSHDSYALSEASKDSSLMTSSMNNIGLAYYNVGSYPEALEFLLRALNLKRKIRQDYGLAQTMNNIGLVYAELKDFDKAREYYRNAISLSQQKNDKDQLLYSLNNIGFTYIDQNELEKASRYFRDALALAATIDNAIWHASAYNGAAQVLLKKDSLEQAKKYFRKSLVLSESIQDQSGIAEVYSFFGKIHTLTGRRDSAQYYLKRSQTIAMRIGDKDLMMHNFDLLKDLYVSKKKFDSALYFQTQFIALRDSVFGKNIARSIKDIQLQIEREQSQSKLAAKDDEIRKITAQTYFLVVMVGLSVIFLFFLYRSYKEQRRLSADLVKTNLEITRQREEIHSQRDKLALSHQELERAKEVIHQKNIELSGLNDQLQNTVDQRTRELEQANKELKVVNLELDNFIYRSSHDIRGPLVRLLGICHVALLDILDEKAKEYFRMFYDGAQQLNEIFDRLKIVSHINEVKVQPVTINFSDLLSQVLDKLKTMNGFGEIEIVSENKADTWFSDPFLLELILTNMIENSIRFQKPSSPEKKFVKIRTMKNGKNLQMAIIDNGIGIKEPDLENLYKMFSKSARDHRNIGLGLYIVKQCLNKLNGSINLVQNDEGYTEFQIVHPILN